jgi:hypothetical protein
MAIVIVLPLPQLFVEEGDVVADAVLVEELVELLVIDAVRAFNFPIQVWRPRADVDVPNILLLEMPVEL